MSTRQFTFAWLNLPLAVGAAHVAGVTLAVAACGFDGEGSLVSSAAPTEAAPAATGHASLPPAGGMPEAGTEAGPGPTMPTTSCSDPTLSFDGVDDVATVADDSQLDLAGDFTVEAWIKPGANVAGGAEMDIVSHYDRNQSQGWALYLRSGRVAIAVWGTESFSSQAYAAGNQGATYVTAGKWAHVAGTKQGDTLRVYYDGVLRDTYQLPFLFGRDTYSGALRLGRAAYVEDFRFQGELDDVRLSNTARYVGSTSPKPTAALPIDSSTIASWRFDEANGNKLVDGKGAHDGSIAPDMTAPTRVASTCIANR